MSPRQEGGMEKRPQDVTRFRNENALSAGRRSSRSIAPDILRRAAPDKPGAKNLGKTGCNRQEGCKHPDSHRGRLLTRYLM